jgi:DNA polymerase-1
VRRQKLSAAARLQPQHCRPGDCILIDGNPLVYRGYYATLENELARPSDGQQVAAVYAFAKSLTKLLRQFEPSSVAVFFDSPHPTFRHDSSPDYKSNRKETAPSLIQQLQLSQVQFLDSLEPKLICYFRILSQPLMYV